MKRFTILLLLLILCLPACGGNDTEEKKGPGTLAIGEFRFSGSAASGQYAPQLFKLNRVIGDQFSQMSGWSVLEKEKIEYPSNNQMMTKIWDKIFDEKSPPPAPKITGADYIMIGEMDSFDVSFNDRSRLRDSGGERVIAAVGHRSWIVRSRVNMRIINTKTQTWLDNQVMMVEEIIPDTGNVESQVNTALQRIAQKIAANALLSISGNPQVAQVNPDSTVILNRGSQHGITSDMKFDLRRADRQVEDPQTGKKITTSGQRYGNLTITDVSLTSAVAKFTGSGSPQVGDHAKSAQQEIDPLTVAANQRNIRVAIGGFHSLGKARLSATLLPGLLEGLEASIANRLGKQAGMSVVEQDSTRIKRLLAQQMLTDLGKKRQPGLPMGTLSGVDYLVFGNLISLDIKKAHNPLKQMGVDLGDMMPYTGDMHAFLYLQDVNTGENVLSEEIRITKKFKSSEKGEEQFRILFEELGKEAAKRFLFGIRPLRVEWVGLDNVLFNHGADSGIQIGEKFEAFTAGENQIDPYTGAILQGMGARLVARLEVIGFSPQGWAMAKSIAGELPEKGLKLRTMQKIKTASPTATEATHASNFLMEGVAPSPQKTARKRLVIGGILFTPQVEKNLGDDLLKQTLSEANSALLEKFQNDGGFVVAEQNKDRLRTMLTQRYLSASGEPDMTDLMQGIKGADYVLYTRLTTAYLEEGKSEYSSTLDERIYDASSLHLQASIFLHDVSSGDLAMYKTVRLSQPWKRGKSSYVQWSSLFTKLMNDVLARSLQAMRPMAVSWVNDNMLGLNHGESAGLKIGDMVRLYEADGRGGLVSKVKIIDFGPTGLAEANIVGGGRVVVGMLAKLPTRFKGSAEEDSAKKKAAAQSRKLSW